MGDGRHVSRVRRLLRLGIGRGAHPRRHPPSVRRPCHSVADLRLDVLQALGAPPRLACQMLVLEIALMPSTDAIQVPLCSLGFREARLQVAQVRVGGSTCGIGALQVCVRLLRGMLSGPLLAGQRLGSP